MKEGTIRFGVHMLFFDCQDKILLAIENCAPYVERIYIAYSARPWAYSEEARETMTNAASISMLDDSKYRGKLVIIEGDWTTEEDQRNACLARAIADGIDYLIIQDPDEFYLNADYRENLARIAQNPEHQVFYVPGMAFWKSTSYVLASPDGRFETEWYRFAISCQSGLRFVDKRIANSTDRFELPGKCFHLSYVLSDDQLLRKLATWAHLVDFKVQAWYERKWARWWPGMYDLHPVMPAIWKKAIRYTGELPAEVAEYGRRNPNEALGFPSLLDRAANLLIPISESLKPAGNFFQRIKARAIREFRGNR